MQENSARRKLDKKLDATARDGAGSTGNPKAFHKAVRAYGKALIDSAMEDANVDDDEAKLCLMCGAKCVSLYCSYACSKEATDMDLGVKVYNF